MNHIILVCTPLRFYSPYDEDALFDWLGKIKSIQHIKGVGHELHLYVGSHELSYDDIWNLRGVFKRYNFDREQLKKFMNDENKNLFTD